MSQQVFITITLTQVKETTGIVVVTVTYTDLAIQPTPLSEISSLGATDYYSWANFWAHRFANGWTSSLFIVNFVQDAIVKEYDITDSIMSLVNEATQQHMSSMLELVGLDFSISMKVSPIDSGLVARMQKEFNWIEDQLWRTKLPAVKEFNGDVQVIYNNKFNFDQLQSILTSSDQSEQSFARISAALRDNSGHLSEKEKYYLGATISSIQANMTEAREMNPKGIIKRQQELEDYDQLAWQRKYNRSVQEPHLKIGVLPGEIVETVDPYNNDHYGQTLNYEQYKQHEAVNTKVDNDDEYEMIDTRTNKHEDEDVIDIPAYRQSDIDIVDEGEGNHQEEPEMITAKEEMEMDDEAIDTFAEEFVRMFSNDILKTGMNKDEKDQAIREEEVMDYNDDGRTDILDYKIHERIIHKLKMVDTRTWTESTMDYLQNGFMDMVVRYIPSEKAKDIYNYLSEVSTVKGILSQDTWTQTGVALVVGVLQRALDILYSGMRLIGMPAKMAHNWMKQKPVFQGIDPHIVFNDVINMLQVIALYKMGTFLTGVYTNRGALGAAYFATMQLGKDYIAHLVADAGADAAMALFVAEDFDPLIKRLVAGGVAYQLAGNIPIIPWRLAAIGGAAAAIAIPDFVIPYMPQLANMVLYRGARGAIDGLAPLPRGVNFFLNNYERARAANDLYQVFMHAIGGEQDLRVRHFRDLVLYHPQLQQLNYRPAPLPGGQAYPAIMADPDLDRVGDVDYDHAIQMQYDLRDRIREHANVVFGPQYLNSSVGKFAVFFASGLMSMLYVAKHKYAKQQRRATNALQNVKQSVADKYDQVLEKGVQLLDRFAPNKTASQLIEDVFRDVKDIVGDGRRDFQQMSKATGQKLKDLYGDSTISLKELAQQINPAVGEKLKNTKDYLVKVADLSDASWQQLALASLLSVGATFALAQGIGYMYKGHNDVGNFPEFQRVSAFSNPIGPENRRQLRSFSTHNDAGQFPEFQTNKAHVNPIGPNAPLEPENERFEEQVADIVEDKKFFNEQLKLVEPQEEDEIKLPPVIEQHIKETYEKTVHAPSQQLIFSQTATQRAHRHAFQQRQYKHFRKGVLNMVTKNRNKQPVSTNSILGKRLYRNYLYEYD